MDIPHFSPHVRQHVFSIEKAYFEYMGVKFNGVTHIVVSACNRSKRLRESAARNVALLMSGSLSLDIDIDPDSPSNNILETKVFAADGRGNPLSSLHIFCLNNSLSITDCIAAFGYEIVGEDSPYDEALK